MKKKIAILGGSYEQVKLVQLARELGYFTIVVDDNPNAIGQFYADKFISTKIRDVESLTKILAGYGIDGITTHAAELSVETSFVAEQLGLPSISRWSAIHATNKDLRIELFREAGIKTANFFLLSREQGLDFWLQTYHKLGKVVVLKPNKGKGAYGVLRVSSEKGVADYYDSVASEVGADHYVMEEFLEGIQLSTETVVVGGEDRHHNIALRHYDGMEKFFPYLIEDGHSMPYELPADLYEKVIREISKTRAALKITNGIIKGDLLIDKHKNVYVIEMASRTSGGRFADFVSVKQSGVQILYALLKLSVGETIHADDLKLRWNFGVSQRFLFMDEGKVAKSIGNLDMFRFSEGVEELYFADWFLTDRYQPKITSHKDRIGYIITRAKTVEDADALALHLRDKIVNESFRY